MNWFLAGLTVLVCVIGPGAAGGQTTDVVLNNVPGSMMESPDLKLDLNWRTNLNVDFTPPNLSRAVNRGPGALTTYVARGQDLIEPPSPPQRSADTADAHENKGDRKVDEPADIDIPIDNGFRWGPASRQALLFLAVQHGYALTQPKTREALRGPFFKDYFRSVRSLKGWGDGGRFFTNYIAHPMQGSFMGFIQVQNDPRGRSQTFGRSREYWKSRMKALAWSAAWSTQFEIGPISQASIGNVGKSGKQTYIDLVVTPTVGTAMLVGEDILDKYVVRRIERFTGNFFVRILSRTLLNPTRTVANIIRLKLPWHRDRGLRF